MTLCVRNVDSQKLFISKIRQLEDKKEWTWSMCVQDNDQPGVDIGGIREIWLKERSRTKSNKCEAIINLMQNTFKKAIDGVTYRFHAVNIQKPGFLSQV